MVSVHTSGERGITCSLARSETVKSEARREFTVVWVWSGRFSRADASGKHVTCCFVSQDCVSGPYDMINDKASKQGKSPLLHSENRYNLIHRVINQLGSLH